MGGVRQQFSTAAEVRLAQESIAFFAELGPPFFDQVGYLFLATTEEGLADARGRGGSCRPRSASRSSGSTRRSSPVSRRATSSARCSAREDGVADPPAVTRRSSSAARVELGVEVREHTAGREPSRRGRHGRDRVRARGRPSSARRVGVELPIRPLCRQLLATEPLASPPATLPMVVEAETGFHFRRRGDRLVLAMTDAEPRWGFETTVDESVFADRLARLARRFPPAAGAAIDRRVGGPVRHDARRAPDPRPRRRRRVRGVRVLGPRLHAVAGGRRAIAEEILDGEASVRPLARTGSTASARDLGFPETVVL